MATTFIVLTLLSLVALKIVDNLFNASNVLLPILLTGDLKWICFNASVNSPAATIALSVEYFPGIDVLRKKFNGI